MSDPVLIALGTAFFGLLTAGLTYLGLRANTRAQIEAKRIESETAVKSAEATARAAITQAEAAADARMPEWVQGMITAAQQLMTLQERAVKATENELASVLQESRELNDRLASLTVDNARLISQNVQLLQLFGDVQQELAEVQNELWDVKGELRAARETINEMDADMRKLGHVRSVAEPAANAADLVLLTPPVPGESDA